MTRATSGSSSSSSSIFSSSPLRHGMDCWFFYLIRLACLCLSTVYRLHNLDDKHCAQKKSESQWIESIWKKFKSVKWIGCFTNFHRWIFCFFFLFSLFFVLLSFTVVTRLKITTHNNLEWQQRDRMRETLIYFGGEQFELSFVLISF